MKIEFEMETSTLTEKAWANVINRFNSSGEFEKTYLDTSEAMKYAMAAYISGYNEGVLNALDSELVRNRNGD